MPETKTIRLDTDAIDMSEFKATSLFDSDSQGHDIVSQSGDPIEFDMQYDPTNCEMNVDNPYVPYLGDPAKRRALIMNLNGYKHLLGHKMEGYMFLFDDLESKTEVELADLLKEVQMVVSQSSSADSVFAGYLTAIGIFENVSSILGIDLENLTVLLNNAKTRDIVLEVYLENQAKCYMSPTKRLVVHTLMTALQVHGLNQAKKTVTVSMNEELDDTSLEEFEKDISVEDVNVYVDKDTANAGDESYVSISTHDDDEYQ